MSIGILKPVSTEKTDEETGEITREEGFEGELRTLRLSMKLRLKEVPDRQSDKAPNYLVYGNVVGHWAEVGKAWKYRIERGDSAGGTMLSIRFEDDEVAASLPSASAFPVRGDVDNYTIERERQRQTAAA